MMAEKYLLIRWPDGREGAVLPADFADPKKAEAFEGARAVSYEDGSEWDGPTTADGMARRAEREVAARREARRERQEARQMEVVAEPEGKG